MIGRRWLTPQAEIWARSLWNQGYSTRRASHWLEVDIHVIKDYWKQWEKDENFHFKEKTSEHRVN